MRKLMMNIVIASGLLMVTPFAAACPGKPCAGACPKGGSHFGEMDKNKDGTVSRKEFDAFHAAHFKEVDANKDGKLSGEEMDAYHARQRGSWKESGRAMFHQRFDESDADRDGGLTREETKDMPVLYERFDEIDANKDGKLGKDEIRALVDKHRQEHGGMMRGRE